MNKRDIGQDIHRVLQWVVTLMIPVMGWFVNKTYDNLYATNSRIEESIDEVRDDMKRVVADTWELKAAYRTVDLRVDQLENKTSSR